MGTNSRIEWCEHTWSPWYCCTRVSEGCANCYMERWAKRVGRDAFGGPIPAKNRMHFPQSKKHARGDFVFVCSLSDFFHDDAPDQWRADALATMSQRPELVFLLLTKRIDVAKRFLEEEVKERIPTAWEVLQAQRNVWLGVTAENQARADERIPELLGIDWPGNKFVSVEPMLGPVDLGHWLLEEGPLGYRCRRDKIDPMIFHPVDHDGLDWVIVGGESGAKARPMHPDWARSVRDQCKSAGVVFSFKQFGEWGLPWKNRGPFALHHAGTWSYHDTRPSQFDSFGGCVMERVGKDNSGKLLDGAKHLERPAAE